MKTGTQYHPVILVLGKREGIHDEVDTWLENSRFSAHEATDVFQALEHVCDFTVRDTPDVVYLHADRVEAEMHMLESMLATTAGDTCASVIAFPDSELRSDPTGADRIRGLSRQLEQLIPGAPHAF